jgi:hypothetical protein
MTQGPFSNTNHLSEILRGFVIFSAKNKTTKAMINISVITIEISHTIQYNTKKFRKFI